MQLYTSVLHNSVVKMFSLDEDMFEKFMYLWHKKRQKKKKRIWAYPYYSLHINHSLFILSREIDQDPAKFIDLVEWVLKRFKN